VSSSYPDCGSSVTSSTAVAYDWGEQNIKGIIGILTIFSRADIQTRGGLEQLTNNCFIA